MPEYETSYKSHINLLNTASVPDCVPLSLRRKWPVSINFGLYHDRCQDNDDVFKKMLDCTLQSSEDYPWLYSEQRCFLVPEVTVIPGKKGGATKSSINIIRNTPSNSKLILAGHNGGPDGSDPMPRPAFIANNITYLESLPFDGLFIYLKGDEYYGLSVSHEALKPIVLSDQFITQTIKPLHYVSFKRLKHNFILLFSAEQPEAFDDAGWNITFNNLNAVLRGLWGIESIKGVCLDNEHYGNPCWKIGTNPGNYQSKMYQRGQQFGRIIANAGKSIMTMLQPLWNTTEPLYATQAVFLAGLASVKNNA